MPFLDPGGDRITALSLLFATLTVGVAVLVGFLYLIFARLIRRSEAEAARHDQSVRAGRDRPEPDAGTRPEDPAGHPHAPVAGDQIPKP